MIAKEPRASESNHWYTRDGLPMYTVEAAKGGQRPTTLRDARKLNLVPSVTTILNTLAKPALNQWLQKQVLMAALTLPRKDEEPEDQWIDRILSDSKEQGRAAADAGTDIHASIQGFYEGGPVNKHHEHVMGCTKIISKTFGLHGWVSERSFSHELGFGGKCDLYAPKTDFGEGIVVDIKTKDFSDPEKIDKYDDHLMQLAAYRVGLGIPKARAANVFVSRSVPGLCAVHEWSAEDLDRGWLMFESVLKFWQLKNQHS